MDCFVCQMLIRKYGLRNFCNLKNRQLSIKELRKSCKRFIEAENDQDVTEESNYPPLHLLFEKVTGAIHSPLNHHKREKEVGSSGCLHHFRYLANRDENSPIPEECLICPNVLKCMMQ